MALTDNLIAYWGLEEASGTRNDSHSTHHLTDNNTVTQAVGKQGNAAQFTSANIERLTEVDTVGLSGSDRDFYVSGWVYFDTLTVAQGLFSKGTGSSNAALEYSLRYDFTNNRFQWRCSSGSGTTTLGLTNFGAPSVTTWYFVEVYHDSVNNVLGGAVNRGTANTSSHSTGVNNTAGAFGLGIEVNTGSPLNGRMDEWGWWDRILSTAERNELYNAGAGRDYSYISGGAASGQPMALRQSHMRRGVARIGRGY